MKKFITAVLAASMLFGSMSGMCVFADVSRYVDYVPDADAQMPVNKMNIDLTGVRTFFNGAIRNSSNVERYLPNDTSLWSAEGRCFSPLTLTAAQNISAYSNGFYGLTTVDLDLGIEKDKTYVFSARVKANGDNVRLGLALSNETAASTSYSLDHGTEGMVIGTEYMDFTATIKPADGFDPDADKVGLIVGFPSGVAAGSAVEFIAEKADSVYFGEEFAYDIKNTVVSDAKDVAQNSAFEIKAEVVNQVGSAGSLSQNFDFTVLNEDKTEVIADGFTFSAASDGKTRVDVDENVPVGKYVIFAESKDYEGFCKSVEIDVLRKSIKDIAFEGEAAPANLINGPDVSGFAVKSNSGVIDAAASNGVYTVTAKADIANDKNMKMDGLRIQTALKGFSSSFRFTAGEEYVVSAKVRKNADSTNDKVYFAAGFGQGTEDTFTATKEYGTQGMLLTDEWQEFKDTIRISENYDPETNDDARYFYLGMPDGTPAGSAFDLELSVYIAKEVAADAAIDVVSGSTQMGIDDVTVMTAVLKNQIGIAGYLPQDFGIYMLDSERKEKITPVDCEIDGAEITLSVDALTQPGDYFVVAEMINDDYNIRVSSPLSVDKEEIYVCVADAVNAATAEELAADIKDYASALGLDFVSENLWDAADTAAICKKSIGDTVLDTTTADAVTKLIAKAIVISLYNNSSSSVYNTDGDFSFGEQLALSELDAEGITIYKVYTEMLSENGKNKLQQALMGKSFENIEAFDKEFALETLLKTIAFPEVGGSGYVESVLTKENTQYAGLEASEYLDTIDKEDYNSALARNEFTKTELEEKIEEGVSTDTNTGTGNGSGGGVYGGGSSVTAPSTSSVSVPTTTTPEAPMKKFTDVADSHWAYADIYHLRERGVISGTTDTTFDPEGVVTREQFVKMLCEVMQYAATATETPYKDVAAGTWYAPYISTAVSNGIVYGITEDTFGVGMPIKRQDLCVIVCRALGSAQSEDALDFADSDAIDEYAKSSVAYMSSFGIINGFDDGTFRPQENCTRAQAAKILCTILNMKGIIQE